MEYKGFDILPTLFGNQNVYTAKKTLWGCGFKDIEEAKYYIDKLDPKEATEY